MIKSRIILAVFFVFNLITSNSQNETANWYFGVYAGINFNTVPPTALNNGSMPSSSGSSSYSDGSGNLLFYANYNTVWNKQHVVLANGSGLSGGGSTAQNGLTLKQPGNNTNYYLFTISPSAGHKFNIINMSLAAGLGSVTTINGYLFSQNMEMCAAVKHTNGVDYWIVSHEFGTTNFRAYLLTAAGINTVPIITSIGPIFNQGTSGSIKISPNGKKLGMTVALPNYCGIFDFDRSTGLVSNELILSNTIQGQGCEFSTNNNVFYATTTNPQKIFQWNLCAGNNSLVIASQYTLNILGQSVVRAIQCAQNGKIYVGPEGGDTVGVINNPNIIGAQCGYNPRGQFVGSSTNTLIMASSGFPNYESGLFKSAPGAFEVQIDVSQCSSASFTSPCLSTYNYTGTLWNFGDPNSGTTNTSTAFSPAHTYSGPGTYTVKLVLQSATGNDTVQQIVNFNPAPSFLVGGKVSICKNETTVLTCNGANTYSWSNGANTHTASLSPSLTSTYTITASYTNTPCKSVKTVTVSVLPCTGIPESEEKKFKIYPNPIQTKILFVECQEKCRVKMWNQLGELVLVKETNAGLSKLNIAGLLAGIYFIDFEIAGLSQRTKLIVQD